MTDAAWGAIFLVYVLIAAVPLLMRAGEGDDEKTGPTFDRKSAIWSIGLVVLVLAYALR